MQLWGITQRRRSGLGLKQTFQVTENLKIVIQMENTPNMTHLSNIFQSYIYHLAVLKCIEQQSIRHTHCYSRTCNITASVATTSTKTKRVI